MADFVFLHGDPLMVDYTPSGADVAAGDVVVYLGKACIAHNPIADGVKGAVAWPNGRAAYKMEAGVAFADTDVDDISAGGTLYRSSGATTLTNAADDGSATYPIGVLKDAIVSGDTEDVVVIHGG